MIVVFYSLSHAFWFNLDLSGSKFKDNIDQNILEYTNESTLKSWWILELLSTNLHRCINVCSSPVVSDNSLSWWQVSIISWLAKYNNGKDSTQSMTSRIKIISVIWEGIYTFCQMQTTFLLVTDTMYLEFDDTATSLMIRSLGPGSELSSCWSSGQLST